MRVAASTSSPLVSPTSGLRTAPAKWPSRVSRSRPAQALAAVERGEAVIVDIREAERRALEGRVPGAVEIARNVLEWRGAPESDWRDDRICDPARIVVVMCNQGYQSSLAAATLQRLGLPLATDMDGGFQRWRAEGLPVES